MIDIKQAIDSSSESHIREWCKANDVNRARIERLPLIHYACRVGEPNSVRALYESGANPNVVDLHNRTAIDEANWYGEYRMGTYTEQSQEIVAFLKSVGGKSARPQDIPFWRRNLMSFFRRGGA
jgi:hypothetical protein